MKLGLQGRLALVTGAGRGIGRSIALSLADEGARVAAVSRTASDVESLVQAMGGAAAGHYGVSMDLMPEGAPGEVVDLLRAARFSPIDIVVHNLGGTLDVNDPMAPLADWRKVWRFNLEVAIELNSLLVPAMRKAKWGRIVQISSISSLENHGPVPYCAVKAAVTAYARSLGRALALDGIVVTAVLPGAVFTEGGYWDIASRERPEHVERYLSDRMAIGRFGRPGEIGPIVALLCSDHASFCIGSVVPVDGGQGRSFFGQ